MTTIIFMPDERTIIFLESSSSSAEILQAVEQGSWNAPPPYSGLILAGASGLRAIQQGKRVVILAITPLSLQEEQSTSPRTRPLSPRQAQVLQGLFNGLTTKEIAYQLGLKPRTVKMHIAALKNRFGANTRAQSVGIAAKYGLLATHQDVDR